MHAKHLYSNNKWKRQKMNLRLKTQEVIFEGNIIFQWNITRMNLRRIHCFFLKTNVFQAILQIFFAYTNISKNSCVNAIL